MYIFEWWWARWVGSTSRPAGYCVDPLSRPWSACSHQILSLKWIAFFILKQLHYGTVDFNDVHIFNDIYLFHRIPVIRNWLNETYFAPHVAHNDLYAVSKHLDRNRDFMILDRNRNFKILKLVGYQHKIVIPLYFVSKKLSCLVTCVVYLVSGSNKNGYFTFLINATRSSVHSVTDWRALYPTSVDKYFINTFLWDAITHPCPNVSGEVMEWVCSYIPQFMWMELLSHASISVLGYLEAVHPKKYAQVSHVVVSCFA